MKKTSGELTFSRGETTSSWGETTLSWGETTWGETDLGRNDRNSEPLGTGHYSWPAGAEKNLVGGIIGTLREDQS